MSEPARKLTRAALFQKIAALPEDKRGEAAALAFKVFGGGIRKPREEGRTRDILERRKYLGRPFDYFSEVLGQRRMWRRQEEIVEAIERNDRVLIPAGVTLGKSYSCAAYALYRFDVVAALEDEGQGIEEQGGRIILLGPSHDTIKGTIWSQIVMLAAAAERRGFVMPGWRSQKSPQWFVRPDWYIKGFAPARQTGQSVAHSISGQHHRNLLVIIEEIAGVDETTIKAAENVASTDGNKMLCPFNPTEAAGPGYTRASDKRYFVMRLSAFEHPNIVKREAVIPNAIGWREVESRVRNEARDLGPVESRHPNPKFNEFAYALHPDVRAPEDGGRNDGIPGHPDAVPHVFRPMRPLLAAELMGLFPLSGKGSPLDGEALQRAIERWKDTPDPERPPDRVGLDVAYGKDGTSDEGDEVCAAPSWGPSAGDLLGAFFEARDAGPEAVASLGRIHVGEIRTLERGDGPSVATQTAGIFPDALLYVVDKGGPGTSASDYLETVIGANTAGVYFGSKAPEPAPAEDFYLNLRAALYMRAFLLINFGLADVPDDPLLIEELKAHKTLTKWATNARSWEEPKRVAHIQIIEKAEIRKLLGRSPDRADAYVLSLHDPEADAGPAPRIF